MINKLRINNYAIIEDVEIEFLPQLIVITGETGAGKSILLGALNLVLGQRADLKALGDQDKKCIVEAEFSLENDDLKSFFEMHELDFDRDLILRREISPQGKSRAFINDTPVTLDILLTISHALIDIHQQFDTLDIYHVSTQLRMIDAIAGNKSTLKEYQSSYKKYIADQKQLNDWKERLERERQEAAFIDFQYKELDELNLSPGEQDVLESEQKELAHASEIKEVTGEFNNVVIESDRSLISTLHDVEKKFQHLESFHSGIKSLSQRLNSVIIELEDIANEVSALEDSIESNPKKLVILDERLNQIYRLIQKHRKKHGDELILLKDDFASKLKSGDDLEIKIASLEKEISLQEKDLFVLADSLHEARLKVIPGFIDRIHSLLQLMSMEQTKVKINLNKLDELNQTGFDEMEFLIATNKGSSFLPIRQMASGGELARFNLVTKSLVAQAIPLPTLIFDEIDIGISGDVALKMGQLLKDLALKHQVICITHSPQIASKGDIHYFVYKDDTSDRTIARVKKLNKNERIHSIATMLSSNPPSAAAMKNAKELIGAEN